MSWWRLLILKMFRIMHWDESLFSPSLFMIMAYRCVPASTAQLANIRAGVQAANEVREAWACRSQDFERVYLVAARIYGPGLPVHGSAPGVWAISGEPDAPGLTLAVNAVARKFSDYPDARKTKAAITMRADGARLVEWRCEAASVTVY